MVRQENQDRFLLLREGVYYYWRRVPKAVAHLDDRAPFIRQSLKTDDLAKARAARYPRRGRQLSLGIDAR